MARVRPSLSCASRSTYRSVDAGTNTCAKPDAHHHFVATAYQVTFDSYLYKKVQGNNPIEDVKLLFETVGCLINGYANAKPDAEFSNPVESLKRL